MVNSCFHDVLTKKHFLSFVVLMKLTNEVLLLLSTVSERSSK